MVPHVTSKGGFAGAGRLFDSTGNHRQSHRQPLEEHRGAVLALHASHSRCVVASSVKTLEPEILVPGAPWSLKDLLFDVDVSP